MAVAPASSADSTSSLSAINPPVSTGTLALAQTRRRILGIAPGSRSRQSGRFAGILSRLSSAMESSRNTRRMAARPSSLARRMKDCRVEMMPSASVVLRIKSTATSLPASPAIRSTCTTAKRPASWMRRTMEEILQISPYNTNTTRIFSLVSALQSPASSLTAAMTGVS